MGLPRALSRKARAGFWKNRHLHRRNVMLRFRIARLSEGQDPALLPVPQVTITPGDGGEAPLFELLVKFAAMIMRRGSS